MLVLIVFPARKRFNRYMVECELCRRDLSVYRLERFNRYMVECESYINGLRETRF